METKRYARFGAEIRRLALKQGIRGDSALARAVGCKRNTVKQWWGGVSLPEPVNIPKLAAALGVEEDQLANMREEAFMASLGRKDRERIEAMIGRRVAVVDTSNVRFDEQVLLERLRALRFRYPNPSWQSPTMALAILLTPTLSDKSDGPDFQREFVDAIRELASTHTGARFQVRAIQAMTRAVRDVLDSRSDGVAVGYEAAKLGIPF